MNTAKLKTSLGLLLLAALILSSACDNSLGFFSGIQTETVQSSNKIFVETATRDIVKLGGNYYAVTKGIYTRAAASGTWSLVSNAAFGDNYRCVGIAVVGTDLYAAIRGSDVSGAAMKGVFVTTDGSSWNLVDSAFSTTKDIQTLYSATDRLYAVVNESGSYNLYHLSGTFVDSGLASSATMATGVVKVGANYWTAQGDKVFNDSADAAAPSGSNFAGIATDGTNVYVVTAGRNVYRYNAGWSAPLALSATTTELPSGIAYVADPAATPRLVVGLSGSSKGYYEVA
ncbi:MAG: hypothetical protein JNG85_08605, partial [Spirochaetaceae bacterium]|nr:hypothetical protein [Spirochaetaceae bacterium]